MYKVEKAIVALSKTFPADGLVPINVNPNDGTAYGTITFGAMGDRSSHLKLPRPFFFWLHISSNFLFNVLHKINQFIAASMNICLKPGFKETKHHL